MEGLLSMFLHLDTSLNQLAGALGPWLYALLFLIVFCETGLVVTPFLPGDSLLFAVGALAAVPDAVIHPWVALVLLAIAAVSGDAVNYAIGRQLGPRVFTATESRLLNRDHLLHTQRFYEKYGGKTIVLARFIPIIRTFAPFVAGIGRMEYGRFALFNVSGGVAWVILFVGGGYLFGNIPTVKENFHIVIVAIIVISVLPAVIEFFRARAAIRSGAQLG
jgi:membrane-associated protein